MFARLFRYGMLALPITSLKLWFSSTSRKTCENCGMLELCVGGGVDDGGFDDAELPPQLMTKRIVMRIAGAVTDRLQPMLKNESPTKSRINGRPNIQTLNWDDPCCVKVGVRIGFCGPSTYSLLRMDTL